jgi:O-antigen ligase
VTSVLNPALLAGVGVIGLGFAVLALLRPRICLVAFVVLDVTGLNNVIAEHVGVSTFWPMMLLSLLALLVLVRRGSFRFRWSPVLLGVLVLYAGFCLSLVNAADPAAAQAVLIERGRDLVVFLLVLALLLSTAGAATLVRALVATFAALAGLTAVHEFVLGNQGDLFGLSNVPLVQEGGAATARHAGTVTDVNFWGRLLILALPLALSLTAVALARRGAAVLGWSDRDGFSPGWFWPACFWACCTASLGVGIFLTQSRGDLLATLLAVLVWLVLAGGWYRRSLLAAPVVLAVLIPLSGIGSRLLTLFTSAPTATVDPSVAERTRLQLAAWEMFKDAPFTGQGVGSYRSLFSSYDRLSNYSAPVRIDVAAHNLYLEQAADVGVLGLLAWAVFVGAVTFALVRCLQRTDRRADAETWFLAVGLLAALIGWLAASVFLHLSDFRALLAVAALAAALDASVRDRPPLPARPEPSLARRRVTVAVCAVLVLASAAGLVVVAAPTQTRYADSATLGVVPVSTKTDGAVAYLQDVVSRGMVVPTFVTVLNVDITPDQLIAAAGLDPNRAGRVTYQALPSRLGGAVEVTVTADDEATAERLGQAAVELSHSRVLALGSYYRLEGRMAGARPADTLPGWVWAPLAVLLAAGLAGLWLSVRSLRRRERSSADPAPRVASGARA